MEVKLGYKLSEGGITPEGWGVLQIIDLCTDVLDCHHSTPVWTESGSLVIRNQNIKGGKLDLTDPSFTNEEHYEERTRRAVPTFGDLVITREAPMGLVCMIPYGVKCCLGQRMVLLRPSNDIVEAKYLLYAILSEPFQRNIAVAGGTGSTVSNLRIPVLKNLQVLIPPLPEQQAIATALSEVDDLLSSLDQLIAKKRNLKQAAMQQLLTGRIRLSGFSGEWEMKRLGEVAYVSKGTQLRDIEADKGGKFAHLNGGIGPSSYTHKSNTVGQTIAISEGGNSCGFVQFMAEPYWCGGHCYSVISNGVDNHFLYQALKGEQSAIMGLRVGSGLPNVQKAGLLDFKLCFPVALTEQTAISEVLTAMDRELAALEQQRAKTQDLKQGMMQELLTGRTRLV
jgi:type I restriction enzyme S subunit